MNLSVNARDAMPDGGCLTIETENIDVDPDSAPLHGIAPGSYVLLAVSDDGTGMDKTTLSRLFDPFFTRRRRAEEPGSGWPRFTGSSIKAVATSTYTVSPARAPRSRTIFRG